MKSLTFLCGVAVAVTACAGVDGADDADDGEQDTFLAPDGKTDGNGIRENSDEAKGVLFLVNNYGTDQFDAAGVARTATYYIFEHRNGPDWTLGTADDDRFDNLAELDAVAYVGPITFDKLLARARLLGFVGPDPRFWTAFAYGPVAITYAQPSPATAWAPQCTMHRCSGPYNCLDGYIDPPADMNTIRLSGNNPGTLQVSVQHDYQTYSSLLGEGRWATLDFRGVYDASTEYKVDMREIGPDSAKVTWSREKTSYSSNVGGTYVTEGVYCSQRVYTAAH
jgi:hypothetical protein